MPKPHGTNFRWATLGQPLNLPMPLFSIHKMGKVTEASRALGTVPQLHECLLRCNQWPHEALLPYNCGAYGGRNLESDYKWTGGPGTVEAGCGSGQEPGPLLPVLLTFDIPLDLGFGPL